MITKYVLGKQALVVLPERLYFLMHLLFVLESAVEELDEAAMVVSEVVIVMV